MAYIRYCFEYVRFGTIRGTLLKQTPLDVELEIQL